MVKFLKDTYVEFLEDYVSTSLNSRVYFLKGKKYKLNQITVCDGMTIYWIGIEDCAITNSDVFKIIGTQEVVISI